ncbi:hypothetical protein JOM56_011718 [Amanita muscaria]
MPSDHASYNALLDRIKRHRSITVTRQNRQMYNKTRTFESFMTYGLGSGVNGITVSVLPCPNATGRGQTLKLCPNAGLLTCSKIQHAPVHRTVCQNVFLDGDWKRCCTIESALGKKPVQIQPPTRHVLWSSSPAFDCIQLNFNEGLDAKDVNFRLCFADSPDILNLVQTVNNLPRHYRGKCDILLNYVDAIVTNRNLPILYALLSPGPSIEEAAALATHLMYSSMLLATGAAYMRRGVRTTYGQGPKVGRLSFQICLDSRGKGRLHCMQMATAIKRPLEMFISYGANKASKSV